MGKQTAMDVKIEIASTLDRVLKSEYKINYKKFVAEIVLQTGYSRKFVEEVVQLAEDAERVIISGGFITSTRIKKKDKVDK